MNRLRIKALWPLFLLLPVLSGCGRGMDDLEQWVAEVKARDPGGIEPFPQNVPYVPFAYQAYDLRSPFVPGRDERTRGSAGETCPDPSRPQEPLEAFSLDALDMRGTFTQAGQMWALVLAPGGKIHRVQPGNYMGQNDGRIVEITPSRITLIEWVENNTGGCEKRQASLALETE